MKKTLLLFLLLAVSATAVRAQFTTAGDGTVYSFKTLSELEGTDISVGEAKDTPLYHSIYQLPKSITIAEGDKFVMDDGIIVRFGQNVTLCIEGEADFCLSSGSLFDSALDGGETLGASILIKSKTDTPFANCHFYTVGLELMSDGATSVSHCHFYHHDGSSAAALFFITAGAQGLVDDCHFEHCAKAAIGSAANAPQPMTISHCSLEQNSTANNNIPQINITAANGLTIEDCTITGNPENTMVGGIGISNFMSYDADITISGCTISDNRYGIGLVGPAASIRIENCTLMNNRYETNPMNGGSGISLYDPYLQTCAMMTGNHIEGSLWGVTVIGCKDVNLGCLESNSDRWNPGGNSFKDNGNGGQLYDLYNNSKITVFAQGNTWNVSEQTEEQIETVVFHQKDDPKLGEVIFWPAAETPDSIGHLQFAPGSLPRYSLKGQRLKDAPRRGLSIIGGKIFLQR
jgi:parallel beta-helix repeat protein